MEGLLPVGVCVRCGHPFRFRISRFGCVFSCPCGECIDVLKAAAVFAASLRSATRSEPFVPLLSSPCCELTDTLRIAAVELDFDRQAVAARFLNLSDSDVSRITNALSLALRGSVTVRGRALTAPAALLDQLVDELREAAQDPSLPFFVNAPQPGLREAVAIVVSQSFPADALEKVPPLLRRSLKQHQVGGVAAALRWGGRILFADDMGVGKTLQAIATVAALEAYPLLVVCPSAVKFMWADHVEQYLHEQVPVDRIHLIHGANDALAADAQPQVVVVSYHMAAVLESQLLLRSWRCLLCDESHLLHTNVGGVDATYTRTLAALARQVPHCLLLSGTPAADSPFDFFNQVDMLRPGLLGATRYDFALRYCRLALSPHLRVAELERKVELLSLLHSCCMLRRLKAEVLELPAKSRVVMRVADAAGPRRAAGKRAEASYQERYANSWRANWKGIAEAIEHISSKYERVVLLAHHIELIDALIIWASNHRKPAVRIDGRVPAAQRGELLSAFQRGEARLAIIGVTACAVGISLAPAQCAVFCELPPDAAWMRQAEDRLHRPGQHDEVVVFYLLGLHSQFDAELFSRLCGAVGEGEGHTAGTATCVSLSQVAHEPQPMLRSGQLQEVPAPGGAPPSAAPLHFRVSKNTGRIHVRAREPTGFYATYLWHEAMQCVQHRLDPAWQQLDCFLASIARVSPFRRRQLVLANTWLPATLDLTGEARQAVKVTGSRRRYARGSLLGWGVWWEVRRLYFPTRFYFGPLVAANGALVAGCLNCASTLLAGMRVEAARLVPGAVCCADHGDAELFCSGECRHAFFLQRSGGAIRRSVAGVDKGVCSNCHVDCETLCAAVAAAAGRPDRVAAIRRLHPQMLQFPSLCERVIASPVSGNFWHADHVVPVVCGGGQATLANLQTLCVVCHALKTTEDLRQARQQGRPESPEPATPATTTTVDAALERAVRCSSNSRVTRRRAEAGGQRVRSS